MKFNLLTGKLRIKSMHGAVKCDSVGVLVQQKIRSAVLHYTAE